MVEFDHFRKSGHIGASIIYANEAGVLNAVSVEQGMTQRECLVKLNQIAIYQMSIWESGDNSSRKLLK